MKAFQCEYIRRNPLQRYTYICTVDDETEGALKECQPLSTACDRAVLKGPFKDIPMFKTERLA